MDESNEHKHLYDIDAEEVIEYTFEGDSGYHNRVLLDSGYILATETDYGDFFTSLTYQEYFDLYKLWLSNSINIDSILLLKVIDKNPFQEFYIIDSKDVFYNSWEETYRSLDQAEQNFRILLKATHRINQIIKDNELGDVYHRVK
jgi:hypothetical protein